MPRARTQNRISAGAYAAANMPVNSVLPAITGDPTVGETLTSSSGTWSKSPAFTYQWQADGNAIPGGTSSTFQLTEVQTGKAMRCTVKATKSGVSAVAVSAATAAVEVASGDFTNIATNNAADGVYTLNGVPCAITDIIDTSHPDSVFNPVADLDADGIMPHATGGGGSTDSSLYMKGALLAQLLGGFTVVMEGYYDATNTGINLGADDADYNLGVATQTLINDNPLDRIRVVTIPSDGDPALDVTGEIQASGIHKIAITYTDAKTAFSFDGGAPHVLAEASLDETVDKVYMNVGGTLATSRLRSFTFYEVVEDADLPGLST